MPETTTLSVFCFESMVLALKRLVVVIDPNSNVWLRPCAALECGAGSGGGEDDELRGDGDGEDELRGEE